MQTDSIRTYGGAVAVITGGASGIGAALGRGLVARGATVVLADRHGDGAAEVASALRGGAGRAEPAELDVRDAAAVESLIAGVFSRHGRLDYLFNNAGVGIGGEVKEHELDDWRYIVEVNLMGVIHGVQAAYGRMIRQGFGHIVNTASVAGLMSTPLTTAYSGTKHAVVGLSRSLRVEAIDYGVRVSVICPGVIRTEILNGGRYGRLSVGMRNFVQTAAVERARPMDANRFADRALRQVGRNQAIIIVPRWWRGLFWVNRLSPGLFDRLALRVYRDVKRELAVAAR